MNVIAKLRDKLAGDTMVGLDLSAFRRALENLPRDRKLELHREHAAAEEEFVRGDETARAGDVAEAEALARKALDNGRPARVEYPVVTGERCKAFAERWQARRREFGCRIGDGKTPGAPSEVLLTIRERIKIIAASLAEDFKVAEPRELAELRQELSRATAAEWQASAAVVAARKLRNGTGGTAAGVDEAPILAAVEELNVAAAKAEALRRRLWAEFAVTR